MPSFRFDNSYVRELPGLYAPCQPEAAPAPRLLYLNHALATELGLDAQAMDTPAGAALFAGSALPEGAMPIAQAYAGHQFGHFSPQLGDGRALLLGEHLDPQGQRHDIAFKGSGRTPFSRNGDGKAAVGPMLRELIMGEAMHALGIPSTRALAVAATGEQVVREQLLPGAVLTRVAASHLRVGTFQYYAARRDTPRLRLLADYTIARHDPDLQGTPAPYLALLQRVAERQATLIAQWMGVGFIHGVMNTDNMTLSGQTIDYGPCAFMEGYQGDAVFSSIDHGGRYAFENQPHIARWNLSRLAETLLPLIADEDSEAGIDRAVALATEVIDQVPALYQAAWLKVHRAKLGLQDSTAAHDEADTALTKAWLALLAAQKVDFTLAWRRLGDAAQGQEAPLRALFAEPAALDDWLAKWRARCASDDGLSGLAAASTDDAAAGRTQRMHLANPWALPRNHLVEAALAAATAGDMAPLTRLLDAVRTPYQERAELAPYGQPAAPEVTACYRTFCGT